MKLGILGTGMIVQDLLKTMHKFPLEKIAILGTENTKELTEQLKTDYKLDEAFYDYEELLNSDIDTVYVALPNFLHYSFTKKALERGKHAIIEKPICSNARELEDLIATANETGAMIFEAMNIHYTPSYQGVKEDLKELGDIKVVSFNYSQYSSRYNAFKEGTVLPAFDPAKSGGALMDINVYNVHAILGLFGAPKSAKYSATIERNIDTSGIMTYDYGSFKAVSIGAKDCKAPTMSTIQGDNAVILIEKPVNQMTEYKILYNDGHEVKRSFHQEEHRLYYEFMEFIRMVDEKDVKKQQELLNLSLEISQLMEKTRKEEGIIFGND